MQRQAVYMRRSLFDQEYVDEQFTQLEELQDDANPNFVAEVVNLFFTNSARFIRNIELALIGAKRVKRGCSHFEEYCNQRNIDGKNILFKLNWKLSTCGTYIQVQEGISRGEARICHSKV
ncbi:pseudo histidine-containing phosphotransfer protein 2 isoform X1 [Nicotiana tabacum]|uniref:Pseudo histidine-containing phosphotransfer protein 2 isoform X1 n=2 Tax=Nicotiana TaxID=4085 RepID=A0AC58UHI8_TOBAC|nr:PREDICTED: histidine-containing phosphotransfer protein 4-like isoform X1 [Nicotiana sylvestris]